MEQRAESKVRLSVVPSIEGWLDSNIKSKIEEFGLSVLGELSNGTGAGQCNRAIYFETTIPDTSSITLDICTFANIDVGYGNGKNFLNQSVTLSKIVFLGIVNDGPSPVVMGTGSNLFQGLSGETGEGGFMSVYNPSAAAIAISGTNKNIYPTTTGGNAKIKVLILGRE